MAIVYVRVDWKHAVACAWRRMHAILHLRLIHWLLDNTRASACACTDSSTTAHRSETHASAGVGIIIGIANIADLGGGTVVRCL